MVSTILLAAGTGSRMKKKKNKVYLYVGNNSLMQWCLMHMQQIEDLHEIIVVVAEGEESVAQYHIDALSLPVPVKIVKGGATRQESALAGLKAVEAKDIVLIHDGARPMADCDLYDRIVAGTKEYGAVVPAVPVKNTIKVAQDGIVEQTLPRSVLYGTQTPQGFKYDLLMEAHEFALENFFEGTDDASLVEFMGKTVHIIEGDYKNCKITTPEDLVLARHYLGAQYMKVGYGYDIHRLVEGRPCILGGVKIDSPLGPLGHSDADVVLHAIMDALLGAAGLRDIGYYFPTDDEGYKDASSLVLLEQVYKLILEKGYEPNNVDVMVISEVPKINPYVDEMKINISNILRINEDCISIKATTNEGLGAIGNKEGIAAQAVVSIIESEDF